MVQMYEALELGHLPTDPVFFFLARLASLMYAVHAGVVLFVSFEVERYARLISFLGVLLVMQGTAVTLAGLHEEIPLWWTLGDGSAVIVCGALILVLQRGASTGERS